MRFLNAALLVVVVAMLIRAVAKHGSDVTSSAGVLTGALLWAIPFFMAWRGLGRNASASTTNAAWIVNLAVALLMLVAFGAAFLVVKRTSLAALIPFVVVGFFALNVKVLAIRKRDQSALPARIEPVWQHPNADDNVAAESGGIPTGAANFELKRARSNYFMRHWRGELSLPVSYWINGSLLTVVCTGLIAIIGALERRSFSLRLVAVTSLVILAGTIALCVWSMVGIWRSAGHHSSRGGSSGWAVAARVMVVFGVIGGVSNLTKSVLPQMHEFALIAIGQDPIGRIRVSVSPDGRSVIVVGTLREGAAAKVESVLNAAPAAQTLVLNSNGGRVLEAEQIARMVRSRQLGTYVERQCSSACTYVFLAGKTRVATPNARIGFHQPSFVGLNSAAQQRATQAMLDVYRDAGLPDEFIRRIGETPSTKMWYPTCDELLRANVVTRVAHPFAG